MKIECTKENLIKAVSLVEKISGKNLTLPVLNCILLEATKKSLRIRATNLELGIEFDVPCKIIKEGTAAIPGMVLLNTLSHTLHDKTITLTLDNKNLVVSTPGSKTVIKAYEHEDFPTLPRIQKGKKIMLKTDVFVQGLQSVWYSASLSTIKPELSSVYVCVKNGKMLFVATDSFRLAEKTIVANSTEEIEPFLIPIKNVSEIIRVLEYAGEEIELQLNQNQLAFVFEKIYLTSRLIDGSFPDYKQIIPKEDTTEVITLKQDFLSILKKAAFFSDTFHQVQLSIKPSKKVFSIASKNTDLGETVDAVPAAIKGDSLDINFNHRYISDCFQSISTDSITLLFNGISKPMIIKGIGDNSFLYLVMPMNK